MKKTLDAFRFNLHNHVRERLDTWDLMKSINHPFIRDELMRFSNMMHGILKRSGANSLIISEDEEDDLENKTIEAE